MCFCAMMRAWNSTLALLATRDVNDATRWLPPSMSNFPSLRNCSVTVSRSMGSELLNNVWMARNTSPYAST